MGPSGTRALTLEQLRKLPATGGQAGVKSSTGKVTLPAHYEGVDLRDLVAAAGCTVDVIAGDGAKVTLDSSRLERNDGLIVACLLDGAPLPGKSFPLRLTGPGLKDEERIGGIARIVVHAPGATRAR